MSALEVIFFRATKANFKMGPSYLPLLIASPILKLFGSWTTVWNRVRIGWKRGRPQLRILPVCVMSFGVYFVGPVPVRSTCTLNIGRTQREQRPSFLDLDFHV